MIPVIDVPKTGKKIAELMDKNGYSVRDVAEVMGFRSQVAVYKWRYGNSCPTIDHLVILAGIFNTTLDEIIQVEWREL